MTIDSQSTVLPLLIVGGGPAGYTAAVYAARAMLRPVLVEGWQPGGQLTITTEVENWPGDTEVQGPALMDRMRAHALATGAEIRPGMVTSLSQHDGLFHATLEDGTTLVARAVVAATGAVARWLGVPGEEALRGFGVSACATCDGFFFRGKEVAVVGGGNTALEEALFLTRFASKVTIVHRRDRFRGEKILQERVLAHPKIAVLWDHQVAAIKAGDAPQAGVVGLELLDRSGTPTFLPADGVFVAIGHAPASGWMGALVDRHPDGTVVVEPGTARTRTPGLFAAGDVADGRYRQAVTSAAMGCMAALDAERWLAEHPPLA